VRVGTGASLPITIDVIIERELLILLDRTIRENAHPDVLPDRPLCNVAIRVARVVRESTDSTTLGCIDELQREEKKGFGKPPPTKATTHLVLL
jgi:hypothetical protein